jgi:acetyl-CoA carboxylase carboxyl transferase subunit alpha
MKDLLPHEKPLLDYQNTLNELKKHNDKNGVWSDQEIQKLEVKLDKIKKKIYNNLTPWQRVTICRHPARPHSSDYIKNIFDEFHELCGDRTFSDDRAIIGGLATIEDQRFVVIGQEKGKDTESRIEHNFGMPHPEGYRKALRLMKLAEKFNLPIISFLDTPGAYPGLTAEERGQGWAIATNLMEMSRISTPIIVILIGEGCSGGALGMGIGDKIAMLEHAYYSVISPEGCASILWKDAAKNVEAAETLRLNAENLKEFEIIDDIIKEPQGGAHHQPNSMFKDVKAYIQQTLPSLLTLKNEELLESRYEKFRKMGAFTAEVQAKVTTQKNKTTPPSTQL